jgi:hypothetical protein
MGELRTISANDVSAASEITEAAYGMLQDMWLPNLVEPGVATPEVIGISGVCGEASDAVTRAAHSLGIMAARECHTDFIHCITGFGPADREPAEDDPILCLTWGQFNAFTFNQQKPEAYFGRRNAICEQVNGYYHDAYSSWSVSLRQLAHTPGRYQGRGAGHVWLETTPGEVRRGASPIGEVARDAFPDDMWEPEIEEFAGPTLITS